MTHGTTPKCRYESPFPLSNTFQCVNIVSQGPYKTTYAQYDFLSGYLDEYQVARVAESTTYVEFWKKIETAYLGKWPEEEILYPGRSKETYSDDEKEAVKRAITQRKEVSSLWSYCSKIKPLISTITS